MRFFDRRHFLASTFAAGVGSLAAPQILQGQTEFDAELAAQQLVTPETKQAVRKGLKYLASRQNEDGSLGRGNYSRNVAICALSGMAFMAGGGTPGRGPYGRNVARCVQFILDSKQESGFISVNEAASHGPMYGHGFATLFLAECYGMSPDSTIRESLAEAVTLIVESQNDEGGWRYRPAPAEADISVSICQIMALRAARNAGIYVPNKTIERCIDYVKRSQNSDGGFMYMLQGGPSAFPRSAAGLVALYSAGIYEGDEIDRGLEYLKQFTPGGEQFQQESHYFYGQYYAVQAMWHAGGDQWKTWYPGIRDELVRMQQDNGRWLDLISPEYGTAMACIVLQMPNNYLPIFQR